jgi:hypothetical protein
LAVSKTAEPVEKIIVVLVVVPKQAQTPLKQVRSTYKTGFSASEQRSDKGMTGFFYSLKCSRKLGGARHKKEGRDFIALAVPHAVH